MSSCERVAKGTKGDSGWDWTRPELPGNLPALLTNPLASLVFPCTPVWQLPDVRAAKMINIRVSWLHPLNGTWQSWDCWNSVQKKHRKTEGVKNESVNAVIAVAVHVVALLTPNPWILFLKICDDEYMVVTNDLLTSKHASIHMQALTHRGCVRLAVSRTHASFARPIKGRFTSKQVIFSITSHPPLSPPHVQYWSAFWSCKVGQPGQHACR